MWKFYNFLDFNNILHCMFGFFYQAYLQNGICSFRLWVQYEGIFKGQTKHYRTIKPLFRIYSE
jgi:hypothetical protein